MARQNRSEIFDPLEASVCHCINRAVRRAMLCGEDPVTGKSFEHRREWVRERLIFLASQSVRIGYSPSVCALLYLTFPVGF